MNTIDTIDLKNKYFEYRLQVVTVQFSKKKFFQSLFVYLVSLKIIVKIDKIKKHCKWRLKYFSY